VIKPSESIDRIAERYMSELPWTIRLLLRLVGAAPRSGGSTLVSFLLSEKKYCQALIELGYHDAQRQRDEIVRFLGASPQKDGGIPQ
jgi:NTE family protein